MGMINTEQSQGLTWRFGMFLVARHTPGFGRILPWAVGRPRLRRHPLLLGSVFADSNHLDGPFDEFFLRPLRERADLRAATIDLLRSFDTTYVRALPDLHAKIDVPVQLVWGREDPFFPLAWAEEMVDEFADARLAVIDDASLFCHEERPAEVAEALLPVLVG
jgi:pimeloyl-ACP methyl ester carboxylesterase